MKKKEMIKYMIEKSQNRMNRLQKRIIYYSRQKITNIKVLRSISKSYNKEREFLDYLLTKYNRKGELL